MISFVLPLDPPPLSIGDWKLYFGKHLLHLFKYCRIQLCDWKWSFGKHPSETPIADHIYYTILLIFAYYNVYLSGCFHSKQPISNPMDCYKHWREWHCRRRWGDGVCYSNCLEVGKGVVAIWLTWLKLGTVLVEQPTMEILALERVLSMSQTMYIGMFFMCSGGMWCLYPC